MRRILRLSFLVGALCAPVLAPAQTPPPISTQAARDLATRLIGATDAEWRAFLDQNPDRIDVDLRRGFADLANRLRGQQRLAEALTGYERARQVASKIGERYGEASALIGIGTIHGQRGDYLEAARFLREGLAISESIGDANAEVAMNNLGIVHRLQGEYEEALDYYRRALVLADRAGLRGNMARTLNNIGSVHLLRGSYQEALEYFQRSLRLKEETGQAGDIYVNLANIGSVYERMGDFELALEYHRRSLSAAEKVSNPTVAAPMLANLGRVYRALARYDLALEYGQRALSLLEEAGRKAEAGAALQSLGDVYKVRGDLAGALDYYRRSLALAETINNRPGMAGTLTDIATAERRSGDRSASLESAQRAARVAGETGNRETLWLARVAEGDSHEALGHAGAAADAYREAADIVEELRGNAPAGERERQRFLEGRLAPFQGLTRVLVSQGRIADALAVAERAKARVMLDVLRAGRADSRLTAIDERDRERRLERETAAAHARLEAEMAKASPDAAALANLRDAFGAARVAEADFRSGLYLAHPALKLSRGDTEPGSFEDAAAIVETPRDALLEFMVTPDATYLFVVLRDANGRDPGALRTRAFTLAIGEEELGRRVERFRKQLASRDLDAQRTAGDLYRLLLAPAEGELKGRTNVVIVPDGPLWGVAFQALSPSPGHFLIERAAVSEAPSIAVLREMRARRRESPSAAAPTLLALGDPATSAPGSTGPASANGIALDRIPDAARQVQRLRQLYEPRHSQIFVGGAATEDRFVAAAGTPTVLHIAAHGLFDDASPMYSFLALAAKSGAEEGDGRLEAWEVMKLSLRADLTVLAGCETARGRIGAGEGVIGLSWAFFLAGSPRTVVSLWKVDAASTTDLMVAFHQQVRVALLRQAGRPQAAASLRAASLALLRDPRYRHPFYWAGFTVIGDGS